jgi:hypothetical protein
MREGLAAAAGGACRRRTPPKPVPGDADDVGCDPLTCIAARIVRETTAIVAPESLLSTFVDSAARRRVARPLDKWRSSRQNRRLAKSLRLRPKSNPALTRTGRNAPSGTREPCCCETAPEPFRDDLRAASRTRTIGSRRCRKPPLPGNHCTPQTPRPDTSRNQPAVSKACIARCRRTRVVPRARSRPSSLGRLETRSLCLEEDHP